MSGNVIKPGNGEAPKQTGWEMVANMSKKGESSNRELSRETQMWHRGLEKEVMYALLNKDYSKLGRIGEGLTRQQEVEYYDRWLDHKITENDQHEMLHHVLRQDEVENRINPGSGRHKVMEKILGQDSRSAGKEIDPVLQLNKVKLLYSMSGGEFSPAGGMRPSEFDVDHLVDKYETALDFEKERTRAIDKITEIFPPANFMDINKQRMELSAAFDELRHDVYGIQSDYVDAMSRLADKAYRPYWEDINSGRRLFKSAAVCVLSKKQIRSMRNPDGSMKEGYGKMIMNGKEDAYSDDSAYGCGEENVFAVFDGVGGEPDGRAASRGCIKRLSGFMEDVDFTTEGGKKNLMRALNNSIEKGSTTGVVTKIVADEFGGKTLHYVSVGDSRLYVVHRDGRSEQITNDDCVTDEMVYNSDIGKMFTMDEIKKLREEAEGGYLRDASIARDVQEYMLHGISNGLGRKYRGTINEGNMGSVSLQDGDQIILCSDGISGDAKSERLYDSAFSMLAHGREANLAVYNLMLAAGKVDDRTVMVINV